MKPLLRYALVSAILTAPYLLVLAAGWWWLYERGYIIAWAAAAGVLLLAGKWLLRWAHPPDAAQSPSGLQPSPNWAPSSEPAWKKVEELSARARQEDWPLDDPAKWQTLLHELLDTVARQYHPESANPLLEIPVAHIAMIVERVAHDLAEASAETLPGGHILTVNDWRKLKDLTARGHWLYSVCYPVYRWARLGLNPLTGLLRELNERIAGKLFDSTTLDAKGLLLDFVIRKAGYYAIELYSGNLVLDEAYVTRRSSSDAARAAGQGAVLDAEPLRILLIGQVNAGKSSAVNALFGDVKTAVDVLPTTREVTPFVFQREGFDRALIFDTAGYGEAASSKSPFAELEGELLNCDLVLLVCSALTAARQPDRRVLEELRQRWQREPNRRPPPVVVILSHVDMLRPFTEWSPPYDLAQPASDKAQRIADATTVVADELQVPAERVIPVCLLPERLYNVEEGLLPAIIECLPEGSRAKALRCLGTYRSEDYWRRLWRQAVSTGQILVRGAAAVIRR